MSSPSANSGNNVSLSPPKPGDSVSVVLHNKETVEGVVEWVDGNGAWVKGSQRSRWVPIEYLTRPPQPKDPSEPKKGRKKDEESEEE